MEDDGPNDIVLCACVRCKFQTRRRRRIAEEHVRKYGAEDVTQYRARFDAQVQGPTHAAPVLDMTPDPRAASMHHKEARRQAMAGQASTSADPATVTQRWIQKMWKRIQILKKE